MILRKKTNLNYTYVVEEKNDGSKKKEKQKILRHLSSRHSKTQFEKHFAGSMYQRKQILDQ